MKLKSASVGRSSRTPVKHYLLDKMLGKVCGVLSIDSPSVPCSVTRTAPLVAVDLCGGDGLQTDWHDASPIIMYKHCAMLGAKGKASKLDVIEKMPNTYEQLKNNCKHMSPMIATITNGDAREYTLPKLAATQAAFVHCDPNTVDQTPLTVPFVRSFNKYTTYLVTLGCNVSGLKMLPIEKRSGWYSYVEMLVDVLPRHHDAVLFWLNRDEAQWAYLLSIPRVWSVAFTEKAVSDTAKIWDKGVSAVSFRKCQRAFEDQIHRLFLTKGEYDAK